MNEKILALLKEHADKNLYQKWFTGNSDDIHRISGGSPGAAFSYGAEYGMYCLAEQILNLIWETSND